MLVKYNRDYYLENRVFNNNECVIPQHAYTNIGLDWNYFIAKYIDRDLHEKLLPFDSSLLMDFVPILTLLQSGYFETCIKILEQINLSGELAEVKQWLINTLIEADDIGGV